MHFLGETAALAAAVCWSITSLLFAFAVRRLGSLYLNLVRLTMATVILGAITVSAFGTGWLAASRPADLVLLAISGVIGLTVGDWAYFRSMHLIGPRLATLTMALAPPMTVALGIPFLHEQPGSLALAGIILTLAGVAWVVLEQPASAVPAGHRIAGVAFGALGSLGQAVGLVLSKQGMAGGIASLPASSIRILAGTAGVWMVAAVAGRRGEGVRPLRGDRKLQLAAIGATLLGPVAGIWLSLVAVRHTQAGIASTLMATVPVLILPLVIWVRHERVSPRAAIGAILAVGGVAVLFLRG